MLANFVETTLTSLTSSNVTEVFIWLIGATLIFSFLEGRRGRHSSFLEYAPTLMTSLGILGTFVGIMIGLMGFDANDIDKSIPGLLDGLKTAFVTSIVGMLAAVVFNASDAFFFAPRRASNGGKLEGATPDDIHARLQEQTELLKSVVAGLTGQEEGTLVGQLKLLKSDFGDFKNESRAYNTQFSAKLWQELEKFAEMMSKSATSHIIDALRQVIQDFNNKLTEQFGENFKALDASVKKLVDWQAEYRVQIEQMSAQYQRSVDALEKTQQALVIIGQECKSIPQTMDDLKVILGENQHQLKELEKHLRAFVEMRDAAVGAVPMIREKVEEIGEQLVSGAATMRNVIEQGATELSGAVVGASGQLASSSQQVQSTLNEVGQQLVSGSELIKARLAEGAERFDQSVDKVASQLSTSSLEVQSRLQNVGEQLLQGSQKMQVALEEGAEHFKDSVHRTQASFSDMANVVKSSSEGLAETLKDTSTEVSNSSREMLVRMQQSVSEMQKNVSDTARIMEEHSQKVHEQFRKTADEFGSSNEEIMRTVSQSASRIQTEIKLFSEQMLAATRQQVEQGVAGMEKGVKAAIDESGKVVNKELELLEMATAREIEKAMNEMGAALVQITNRFVKDYEQMVRRMDDVIRMPAGVR
ncbi:MotA/TolQ/ExbB proton channel family protein [Azotobacter salinestris]|uniref:MotA/TolQ/ExbB proton channel family protein n=1 Tax=Azotobacter salinestris TaxID=69964 RepID=UPI0032DE8AC0